MAGRISFGRKGGGGGVVKAREGFHELITDPNTSTRYTRLLSGTGASIGGGSDFFLNKGSTATGMAGIKMTLGLAPNIFTRSPKFSFSTVLLFGGGAAAANTTTETYVTFGDVVNGTTATRRHFGFRFRNNNGVAQLYATSADGTTQQTTLLTLPSVGASHTFHAALDSVAAVVTFYVDGVLVATHSTNVPASGSVASNNVFGCVQYGIAGTGADYHYMGAWVSADWDALAPA